MLFLFLGCGYIQANTLENLKRKYLNCTVDMNSFYPSSKQLVSLKSNTQGRVISSFFSYYDITCGQTKTRAFVLSDLIRTQKQFLLVEVMDQMVGRVEVLKFLEPNEYKVQEDWLKRLRGDSQIDIVSGATLTSKSSKFLVSLAKEINLMISNEKKR